MRQPHASMDTPVHGVLAIPAEVGFGLLAQVIHDHLQLIVMLNRILCSQQAMFASMIDIVNEFLPDLVSRQFVVDGDGIDRALQHARVFGVTRVLDNSQAAALFDLFQARCAVRAGTRQHDANRVFTGVFRQRTEEIINRHARTARF
nr:hypothetical protein [Lignipirellula cremea]